jgi:hypothetical protein
MRLRQLIAPLAALSSLATLTGCHLSRATSLAPSMAAIAVSAGGLLGVHLFIARMRDHPSQTVATRHPFPG